MRIAAALLISVLIHGATALLVVARPLPEPAQPLRIIPVSVRGAESPERTVRREGDAAPEPGRFGGVPASARASEPSDRLPPAARSPGAPSGSGSPGLGAADSRGVDKLSLNFDSASPRSVRTGPSVRPEPVEVRWFDDSSASGASDRSERGPPSGVTATPDDSLSSSPRFGSGLGGTNERAGARPVSDTALLQRQLVASARRCYPPAAKGYRLHGEVVLSFCVDGTGELASVALSGTTGSSLLDRAAHECVVQGALPLAAERGCYTVPVKFAVAP